MDDLRLSLQVFTGPLDLLLYLVVKNEMDILDVDVGKVAEQFCEYVEAMRELGLGIEGDYLVMASRLVRMKASYVDPRASYDAGGEDVIDPREELISELLMYRAVKEAALHLSRRFEQASKFYPSGAQIPETENTVSLEEVSLWQLAFLFAKLMKETGAFTRSITVEIDERTVEEYLEELLKRIESRVEFIRLIGRKVKRTEVAGYFLAVLEGVRRGALRAYQAEPFGGIYIERRDEMLATERTQEEKIDRAVG
ncbi:MAG: segregation/condensation protein A [Planctomycetota bacterium]|nr:segregation/condensation protein A [Planctomycetota bacterium]